MQLLHLRGCNCSFLGQCLFYWKMKVLLNLLHALPLVHSTEVNFSACTDDVRTTFALGQIQRIMDRRIDFFRIFLKVQGKSGFVSKNPFSSVKWLSSSSSVVSIGMDFNLSAYFNLAKTGPMISSGGDNSSTQCAWTVTYQRNWSSDLFFLRRKKSRNNLQPTLNWAQSSPGWKTSPI